MTMQDEKCDSLKKERILEETLKLISEEGFDNVTIRKIAKRANVNVALINYHFGSKNKLLNIALKKILSVLMETFSLLENEKVDPLGRLRSFFFSMSKFFMLILPSILFCSRKVRLNLKAGRSISTLLKRSVFSGWSQPLKKLRGKVMKNGAW